MHRFLTLIAIASMSVASCTTAPAKPVSTVPPRDYLAEGLAHDSLEEHCHAAEAWDKALDKRQVEGSGRRALFLRQTHAAFRCTSDPEGFIDAAQRLETETRPAFRSPDVNVLFAIAHAWAHPKLNNPHVERLPKAVQLLFHAARQPADVRPGPKVRPPKYTEDRPPGDATECDPQRARYLASKSNAAAFKVAAAFVAFEEVVAREELVLLTAHCARSTSECSTKSQCMSFLPTQDQAEDIRTSAAATFTAWLRRNGVDLDARNQRLRAAGIASVGHDG